MMEASIEFGQLSFLHLIEIMVWLFVLFSGICFQALFALGLQLSVDMFV